MNSQKTKRTAMLAALALLLAVPPALWAQGGGGSMSGAPPLSRVRQAAANSALCSALASHFKNPAHAGPGALTNPSVLKMAAITFKGSNESLPSATATLKAYAAQHSTDILASCAAGNATGGASSQSPGSSSSP
jgi:hypothetical protein